MRWLLCVVLFGFPSVIGSREPPQFTCRAATYPKVVCEAKNVYPFDPVFTTYIGDHRADREKGVTVYLTLPDDTWATIEMCVGDTCLSAYGGWFDKKARFRK